MGREASFSRTAFVRGLNKWEGTVPLPKKSKKQPEDVAVEECLHGDSYLPLRGLSLAAYAVTI